MVVQTVIPASGRSKQEDCRVQGQPGLYSKSLSQKIKQNNTKQKNPKGQWGMAQVIECLPNKFKALSSIPGTIKNK
jgi:hypothetical protein